MEKAIANVLRHTEGIYMNYGVPRNHWEVRLLEEVVPEITLVLAVEGKNNWMLLPDVECIGIWPQLVIRIFPFAFIVVDYPILNTDAWLSATSGNNPFHWPVVHELSARVLISFFPHLGIAHESVSTTSNYLVTSSRCLAIIHDPERKQRIEHRIVQEVIEIPGHSAKLGCVA
ncbi:MAG: hypothetical protein IPF78_07215 [Flavobacteriales bacterium]|nr:hypothetical protein [Flavobacteriales bacterium]